MEFKDYKEKQKYYRERAKQEHVFWISKPPLNTGSKEKGMTYKIPNKIEKEDIITEFKFKVKENEL